ncbi:hypothetical protein L210DRAFT_3562662, partial [Boletus edulis BED1]
MMGSSLNAVGQNPRQVEPFGSQNMPLNLAQAHPCLCAGTVLYSRLVPRMLNYNMLKILRLVCVQDDSRDVSVRRPTTRCSAQ